MGDEKRIRINNLELPRDVSYGAELLFNSGLYGFTIEEAVERIFSGYVEGKLTSPAHLVAAREASYIPARIFSEEEVEEGRHNLDFGGLLAYALDYLVADSVGEDHREALVQVLRWQIRDLRERKHPLLDGWDKKACQQQKPKVVSKTDQEMLPEMFPKS